MLIHLTDLLQHSFIFQPNPNINPFSYRTSNTWAFVLQPNLVSSYKWSPKFVDLRAKTLSFSSYKRSPNHPKLEAPALAHSPNNRNLDCFILQTEDPTLTVQSLRQILLLQFSQWITSSHSLKNWSPTAVSHSRNSSNSWNKQQVVCDAIIVCRHGRRCAVGGLCERLSTQPSPPR